MKTPAAEPAYKDRVNHSRDFITLTHGLPKPLYTSQKRKDEDRAIRELGAAKVMVGILAFLLVLIGLFGAFITVIFPNVKRPEPDQDVVSQTVEIAKDALPQDALVSYDSATGLPIYENEFNLLLINSSHPVTESFEVPSEEFAGVKLDKRVVPALRKMVSEAEGDGIRLEFSQGMVTYQQQKRLYENKVNELVTKEHHTVIMARSEAKKEVAYPGEADAETGMSVVVKADQADFAQTDVYNWLNRNAAEYGFVFRFPEGKSEYTDMNADYRVLRYVGKENAVRMRQYTMCLEEYIEYSEKTPG